MGIKGNRTKQYIKDQARRLFAQNGYKTVTMKDICEATGLSRGGLYRHYDSTDQIFAEIIEEFLGEQTDLFSESMEKELPAPGILDAVLHQYQSEMLDAEGSLSLAICEYFSSKGRAKREDILSKQYLSSFQPWEKLIAYGIARGEFKDVDARGVFDILLFSYQGVRMYSQLMEIPKETPKRIIEQVKQLLLIEKRRTSQFPYGHR